MSENPYQDDFLTTKQKIENNAEDALTEMYWDEPVKFKKRVQKLRNKIMRQEVFWIPTDVEENQMVALSVPGETPPEDQGDHRQRLLEHLRKLAQELEDEDGAVAIYEVASTFLPDENIRMAPESMGADELIQLMEISDSLNMTAMRDPKAVTRDQTLQEACREMGLEERLATIGTFY